jgi:hypothetical protein
MSFEDLKLAGGGLAFDSEARGDLARRGAAEWERFSAKTAGQLVMGDGNDVVSLTPSGDVASLSAAGAFALADPNKIYRVQKTLTADGTGGDGAIVGNGNGSLNGTLGANSITIIPAPGAGKVILLRRWAYQYTRVTASYGGGGTVSLYANNGGVWFPGFSDSASAAQTFAAAGNTAGLLLPVSSKDPEGGGGNTALVNARVVIWSSAQFTQPGTAAGTAIITAWYSIGSLT